VGRVSFQKTPSFGGRVKKDAARGKKDRSFGLELISLSLFPVSFFLVEFRSLPR